MPGGRGESPGIMTGPMMLLAFLSIVSGWVGIPEGFGHTGKGLLRGVRASERVRQRDAGTSKRTPSASCSAGISVVVGATRDRARLRALRREAGAGRDARGRFSWLHTFLDKGWYFDALYGATFVRFAMWLGRATRGLRPQRHRRARGRRGTLALRGRAGCCSGCRAAGSRTTRSLSCSAS